METISRIVCYVVLVCLFLTSCDEDDSKPVDYRDNYVGKYQVTERILCYGLLSGTCSSQKDTVIIVNYGLTDSTLSVLGRDVYLDSEGRYTNYHYFLRLWNDSIYSRFMNGGLGGGQYETYEGYRILN